MTSSLLLKGIETEVFTGTTDGTPIGLSPAIATYFDDFDMEPDSRNVEHVTPPIASYERLRRSLLDGRMRLRRWLTKECGATVIPGSVLPLGEQSKFLRSKAEDPYHSFIEDQYGTDILTASLHINVGVSCPEELMRVNRVMTMEAALLLALSAASPFQNGVATGWQSTRWRDFPRTPAKVPLFTSHNHYATWLAAQLESGSMFNARHLWTSVRPNGPSRPSRLDRVEVRICDLDCDTTRVLALTAWIEAQVADALANTDSDPLLRYPSGPHLEPIAVANEMSAAKSGLDATIWDWTDGRVRTAREAIERRLPQLDAAQPDVASYSSTIRDTLRHGNRATEWLERAEQLGGCEAVVAEAISEAARQDEADWRALSAAEPSTLARHAAKLELPVS